MVGKGPEMMLAKIMKHFLGKPFKPGGLGPSEYDCLGFVVAFCEMCGKNIPRKYAQYDEQNYSESYLTNREAAETVLIEYFDSFAERIQPEYTIASDIILFKSERDRLLFIAIYLGNNQYASSFIKHGVRIFGPDEKTYPVMAWRVK